MGSFFHLFLLYMFLYCSLRSWFYTSIFGPEVLNFFELRKRRRISCFLHQSTILHTMWIVEGARGNLTKHFFNKICLRLLIFYIAFCFAYRFLERKLVNFGFKKNENVFLHLVWDLKNWNFFKHILLLNSLRVFASIEQGCAFYD